MSDFPSFVKKQELRSEKHRPHILQTAREQYERCLSETPEMLKYKQSPDLTIDEMAELRCKAYGCKLQLCLTQPASSKTKYKDVYTGQSISTGPNCQEVQNQFFECIAKEKQEILNSQKE